MIWPSTVEEKNMLELRTPPKNISTMASLRAARAIS